MSYDAYKNENLGFTTRQLHAGYNPAEHGRSKNVPIYQTAAYEFGDFERGVRLNDNTEAGFSYARVTNPTADVFQRRMASLEGGLEGTGTASGMAAIADTIFTLCNQGDEIVASPTLYGGSINVLGHILPDYGITGRFAKDENDVESYRRLINDKTKAILIESLGNPGINIVDVEAIASLAHEYGIPLIVDNTFPTPYLFRPLEWGADIVVHSATKYLCGHGTTIGGVVVEKGGFDYLNGRFPQFEKFYMENESLIDPEELKKDMFTRRLRTRAVCEFGSHLAPFNAFLLVQGLETLSLRMERHTSNAQKIAEFLEKHPQVEHVYYPGLESSPYHALAQKYFPKGTGAMIGIDVKGGREEAKTFLENVRVFDQMVSVGDAKSMIVHPYTTTHAMISHEEKAKAGIHESTIRISVGIEDVEDLIADLDQALNTLRA